jgi:hypothetical protein
VQADGYPAIHLPWRAVGPDEVWDVGTLRLQPGGSLLVNLLDSQLVPHRASLSVLDASGAYFDSADNNIEMLDGQARAGPLAPGNYLVQVTGDGIACPCQPVEVRAGVELRVDVQVQKGVDVQLECPLPEGVAGDQGVQVLVSDPSGRVVKRGMAWAPEGPPRMSLCLLPGEYRIEASMNALRGIGTTTVAADPAPGKVSVPLTSR